MECRIWGCERAGRTLTPISGTFSGDSQRTFIKEIETGDIIKRRQACLEALLSLWTLNLPYLLFS